MSEWESETHATTTVSRTDVGNIRHIKCRAEYYECREVEDGEDEFAEGVHARFKFGVTDGRIAWLKGVKDIEDDAPSGYQTNLELLRALPAAEAAVRQVPGIEEVQSTEEHIQEELDRGATALH